MYIATNSPVPSGSRIRVEVIDRDRGFAVEGVVAHARKMQPELARLNQSGMGVRFLSVEELVRELIPAGLAETEEISRDVTRAEPVAPPSFLPPPADPTEPFEFSILPTAPHIAAPPKPPPPTKPTKEAKPVVSVVSIVPVDPTGGTFTVRFSGVDEFLEVFQRDILQGGLFVSTRYPARLEEAVSVEMYPPLSSLPPVLLRARVVQRFEPDLDCGPNLLAGMGLELLEVTELIARLEPVVARLKALRT
jgi:hypothetical protein